VLAGALAEGDPPHPARALDVTAATIRPERNLRPGIAIITPPDCWPVSER
jgi:hypothetical protein